MTRRKKVPVKAFIDWEVQFGIAENIFWVKDIGLAIVRNNDLEMLG